MLQLAGEKQWFFDEGEPVTMSPGDALWVPPWTWHRVDYGSGGLSVAASLFHFRPVDFVQRQPFFAFAIVPNLFKELVGWKTQ